MTRTAAPVPNDAAQPLVAIENVSFRYADSERWVLRDINLTVYRGETLLILGPSGCGKSTLALCLNGLIPTLIEGELKGRVVWGAPPSDLAPSPARRPDAARGTPGSAAALRVGSVFQDPETQMVMPRVEEEVAFGLENLGVPAGAMPARIRAALQTVDLHDQARTWIDDLSGGQKQRVALAATLALDPALLVLDEPTANLDPQATAGFFAALARLKAERGLTIVLIEHRLDAVLPLVDRIAAMNMQGEVIAQGATHALLASHADALEREGMWLPMTCQLMRAVQQRGIAADACPLTLDEVEAALRPRAGALWGARAAEVIPAAPCSAETHTEAAIELADVTFAYAGGAPALQNVNLRVRRGSFFALVGGNGSGKTTLAKHLVGLLHPTSGAVRVLGRDANHRRPAELARQVGYVFQNPEHQFVTERVRDELTYSLRGLRSEEEISERVASLLNTFGLRGYEEQNPFLLSQGQKRRLSVATMVALDQPILVLDEPSFGQDQQSTAALMATLHELHSRGVTIIFISHDMQLVAEYADEVAVMSGGRVIFQGSPRLLFESDDVLAKASLARPPLAELSHRLQLPQMLTVAEWVGRLAAPRYPDLASLQGAAGSLKEPLPWEEVQRIAREDALAESAQGQ